LPVRENKSEEGEKPWISSFDPGYVGGSKSLTSVSTPCWTFNNERRIGKADRFPD
jgi:hypothetical protein